MKIKYASKLLLFSILVYCGTLNGKEEALMLEGPYLGQEPPGLTAELFAPGIVSTDSFEAFATVAPGLNEIYFVRAGGKYKKPTLVSFQKTKGQWEESAVSSFSGEPTIAPNGKTMYLGNRYMDKTTSGWSDVKELGAPFADIRIMRTSASERGTLVFDEREEIGTIRYSTFLKGKQEQPIPFGEAINSGKWTSHPFIAPDESYLIWDSEREGGYGDSDLYISFRQEDGAWGPAINLGEGVNSEREDIYGSVTPDGKYLFFHSYLGEGKSSIFWVDAKIIENLR